MVPVSRHENKVLRIESEFRFNADVKFPLTVIVPHHDGAWTNFVDRSHFQCAGGP
jgi:hypothetical protein